MAADPEAYVQPREQMSRSSYKSVLAVNSTPMPNEVCWSMEEMSTKMILDLGCMKTVAGTDWINPIVKTLKQQGRYCKVTPERESFRFGDGHLTHSKFSVLMEVSLATIPCVLRVSVVAGNCPPLLSKHVATSLGFVIDTEQHTLCSKKFHVTTYGLDQSSTGTQLGGHYILPILQFEQDVTIPADFQVPRHVEVYPLVPAGVPKGVRSNSRAPREASYDCPADGNPATLKDSDGRGVQHRFSCGEYTMGRRGHGRPRQLRSGAAEAAGGVDEAGSEASVNIEEENANAADSIRGVAGSDAFLPRRDANYGADAGDAGTYEATRSAAGDRGASVVQQEQGGQGEEEGEVPESSGQGSAYRSVGQLPDLIDGVQQRHHLQHHEQPSQPGLGVQVEDDAVDDAGEDRSGGSETPATATMEEKSKMGDAYARTPPRVPVGPSWSSSATVLESKDLLARNDRDSGREGVPEAGLLTPSDPNAPSSREQRRRYGDRLDLVNEELVAGPEQLTTSGTRSR